MVPRQCGNGLYLKSPDPEICHPYFRPVLQVLHLHPAGVPEDAHGRRQADGTRPGPHLSDAPHTVRHEVSQSPVKIRQELPLNLLLYLWISLSDRDWIQSGHWIRIGIRIQSVHWIRIRNPDPGGQK